MGIGLAHARLLDEARDNRLLTWKNAALAQAHQAAVDASNAKSEFLALVSHEIRQKLSSLSFYYHTNVRFSLYRTPMNAICGMTKVMKSSKLDKDQAECVQIISSSTKALLRLLNDILDFSKIAARKEEIRVGVVPVHLQERSE